MIFGRLVNKNVECLMRNSQASMLKKQKIILQASEDADNKALKDFLYSAVNAVIVTKRNNLFFKP